MKRYLPVFLVAISLSISAYAKQDLYIGIYEPGVQTSPEVKDFPRVRLAFKLHDDTWEAMPNDVSDPEDLGKLRSMYPEGLTLWTQTAKRESVFAQRFDAWKLNSDMGSYHPAKPIDKGVLEADGKGEFSRWMFESKYRPIILTITNEPLIMQPLEKTILSKENKAVIAQAFRKQVPTYDFCQVEGGDAIEAKWEPTDIRYEQALHSGNTVLVEITLDKKLNICAYPEGYENDQGELTCQFCSQWFALNANHQARYLGAGLSLIDRGDYNSDGKQEWIFSLSGYDRDGYVLFSDDFKKRIKYLWSYH